MRNKHRRGGDCQSIYHVPDADGTMSVITQLEQASRESSMSLDSRNQTSNTRQFAPNASIVLIGSRGSGKRSLGFIGATHLGRRLITEDQ